MFATKSFGMGGEAKVSPFDPLNLVPYAWYKTDSADDVELAGAKVATWRDSSGNGNDATQTDDALRPGWNAGIEFNGGQVLRVPLLVSKRHTVFEVFKRNGTLSYHGIIGYSDGADRSGWIMRNDNHKWAGYFKHRDLSIQSAGMVSVPETKTLWWGAKGYKYISASRNGQHFGCFYDGDYDLSVDCIGALKDNANWCYSRDTVSEVLLFDRVLSAKEIGLVDQWLRDKHGLGPVD